MACVRSRRKGNAVLAVQSFVMLLMILTVLAVLIPLASAKTTNPYLCRCTCFGTNSTVVPLFSPIDPQNPCTTCTRQFCLSQSLEACRGARIERPDADTGTGWEGEVWAKCLRKCIENYKIKGFASLTVALADRT